MFNIKQDDLISKTDMLLSDILEELKQLNKSLHPMRKDTVIKKKPKVAQRKKGKTTKITEVS